MKFSFRPTFKDQYLATLTMQVKSVFLLIINLIFPAAGLFLLLLILIGLRRFPSIYEFIVIVLAFAFTPTISALSVFLARRKNKTVEGAHDYTFSEKCIELSGSNFKIRLDWSALCRVSDTKKFLFFYISPRFAYYLPKYVFRQPTEYDDLKKLFIDHINCKNNL